MGLLQNQEVSQTFYQQRQITYFYVEIKEAFLNGWYSLHTHLSYYSIYGTYVTLVLIPEQLH